MDNSEIEKRERWLATLQQCYSSLFEEVSLYNINLPIGWSNIFEELLENIHRREIYLEFQKNKTLEEYRPVKVVQVKQKFGDFRFYYNGGNDDGISLLVSQAEKLAEKTCEYCGSTTEDVKKRNIINWICTTCEECGLKLLNRFKR